MAILLVESRSCVQGAKANFVSFVRVSSTYIFLYVSSYYYCEFLSWAHGIVLESKLIQELLTFFTTNHLNLFRLQLNFVMTLINFCEEISFVVFDAPIIIWMSDYEISVAFTLTLEKVLICKIKVLRIFYSGRKWRNLLNVTGEIPKK